MDKIFELDLVLEQMSMYVSTLRALCDLFSVIELDDIKQSHMDALEATCQNMEDVDEHISSIIQGMAAARVNAERKVVCL